MDRTIKVTNFTLKPAIKHQLREAFERVAQVETVYFSSDRNAAYIRLAFRSGMQFILEQDWEINSDRLNVRPAETLPSSRHPTTHSHGDDESSLDRDDYTGTGNSQSSTVTTWAEYSDGRSKFWADVPHATFAMVPKKTRKRKSTCFNNQGVAIATKGDSKKPKRNRRKKKRLKRGAYLEHGKSLNFGAYSRNTSADQLSSGGDVQSPDIQPEVQLSDLASQQSQGHLLHPSTPTINHLQPSTPCRNPPKTQEVQIFAKGEKTSLVSLHLPTTASQVRCRLSETIQVPPELLHITVAGHTLSDASVRAIESGSTLHFTVRGKGGMEESSERKSEEATTSETTEKAASASTSRPGNQAQDLQKRKKDRKNSSTKQPNGGRKNVTEDSSNGREKKGTHTKIGIANVSCDGEPAGRPSAQTANEPASLKDTFLAENQDGSEDVDSQKQHGDFSAAVKPVSCEDCSHVHSQDASASGLVKGKPAVVKHELSTTQPDVSTPSIPTDELAVAKEGASVSTLSSLEDIPKPSTGAKESAESALTSPKKKKKKKRKKSAKSDSSTVDSANISAGHDASNSRPVESDSGAQETTNTMEDRSSENPAAAAPGHVGAERVTNSTDAPVILPTSSEAEVMSWLLSVCGLSQNDVCIQWFREMDGLTLFHYGQDVKKLMRHTKVSLGKARKICFLRDHANIQSKMKTWSVVRVAEFVRESTKNESDVSRFVELEIDGAAFMSFQKEEDLCEDLGLHEVLGFKIILKRNDFLEQEKHTTIEPEVLDTTQQESSTVLQETLKSRSASSIGDKINSLNKEHLSVDELSREGRTEITDESLSTSQNESGSACGTNNVTGVDGLPDSLSARGWRVIEEDDFAPLKVFLQNDLNLQPVSVTDKQGALVSCKLHVLFNKRKDLNNLERQFMFLVLSRPDLFSGKASKQLYQKLWGLITDRVPSLFFDLLPEDRQAMFTRSSQKDTILHEGKVISFDNVPVKICPLREYDKTGEKISECNTKVLIVDKELLQDDCQGYSLELRSGKESYSFNFGFTKRKDYFFFNPGDFGAGITPGKVSKQQTGLLPRNVFVRKDMIHSVRTMHPEEPVQSASESDVHCNPAADTINQTMFSTTDSERHEPAISPQDTSSQEQVSQPLEPTVKADSSAEPLEAKKSIRPRPFKSPKWKYDQGILEGIESGEGIFMRVRSVEYKFQAGCPAQENRAKRSFLYKSLEFICACLNGRQDGTIYFGIAEKGGRDISYEDGEIVGVEIDQQLSHEYYDLLRNVYIDNCFPDHSEVVKLCVKGPHFVPIQNTSPGRCVIEIDIEADSKVCKDTCFIFDPSSIFEKYGDPGSQHIYNKNKEKWTGIFRRDGSATKYQSDKNRKEFLREDFPRIVKKREDEDKKEERLQSQLLSTPEAEKLKTFVALLSDPSMFPILLLPKLSAEEKRGSLAFFRFLYYIRWFAIFDFDDESGADGIRADAQDKTQKSEILEATVYDFSENSVDGLKEKLGFPKKVPWIFSNGKTTSETAFHRLERDEWKDQYWTFIQTAVHAFYKNKSVIPEARRLALIMVSDDTSDGLVETATEIKNAFSWNNIFFIFSSECAREYFAQQFGSAEKVMENSVVMQWQHVHYVVCECLNVKGKNRAKYVHTASGANVPIEAEEWQAWTDLEVLSTKECEEERESMSKDQRKQKQLEDEVKFYQGKPVSWWNFFWTSPHRFDHVMERSLQSELLTRIRRKMTRNDSSEADKLSILPVVHMPGAGGTTLGRSALWELRKECKCAVINKITENTEDQVCLLWESGEGENERRRLHPVVLLADNLGSESPSLNPFDLCRRLQRKQAEYRLSKPLAVIIHCRRDVSVEGCDLTLTHTLSKEELDWLERKHEKLETQAVGFGVDTLIAFLSMRNKFEKDKLKEAIVQFVNHDSLLPQERELVGYISLITAYIPFTDVSPGIPVTSCDDLMKSYRGDLARTLPWEHERVLSKVAQILLVIEYRHENDKWYVRIANQPYAKVILDTMLLNDNETVGQIVLRCLKSALVSSSSPSVKTVIQILTRMLIERPMEDDPVSKHSTPLSLLIMEIKKTDFNEAVIVFKEAHKTFKQEVFHQQLARLYLMANKLDEAKHYAQLAVDRSPENNAVFKHTLGIVYLNIFRVSVSSNESDVERNLDFLKDAFLALKNFTEAQQKQDADVLHFCHAQHETINTVNQILRFLAKVLPSGDLYNLGWYLTEDGFTFPLFDDRPDYKEALKSLIQHGVGALRYLYRVGHSYKLPLGKGEISRNRTRAKRAVAKAREDSSRQFHLFAGNLKTVHRHPSVERLLKVPENEEDNAYRLEVIKLGGCFFEEIFHQFKNLRKTRHYRAKRPQAVQRLMSIKSNLGKINRRNYFDMDNFLTVCLALELGDEGPHFSRNTEHDLYKMCCQIIDARDGDVDNVVKLRAHLYRILVSWPNVTRKCFNFEQFRRSFNHKASSLKCETEELSPTVLFYIARNDKPFYLCHWSDIHDGDNMDAPPNENAMSNHLQLFSGTYKVFEKSGGDKFSRVEMQWKSACGLIQQKISKIRGKRVYRDGEVDFFLGFSLHGPVAFIHNVRSSDEGE